MKSYLALVFVLGLASAEVPIIKKLTVFGVPEVMLWENVDLAILQTRGQYPFGGQYGYSVNPYIPYNVPYNPYVLPGVGGLRGGDMHSGSISLRDVYHKPLIMMMKTKTGVEGLTGFMLEHGLSSLVENPHTRFIHEMIKTGTEKTAVVVNPTMLYNTPAFRILKDMPVTKFEIPTGIKFGKLSHNINTNMPYVFIHDKDDVNTFDFEGLIRVGSLDIAEEKIICSSCY